MTGVWALAALWLGLALIASLLSIWLRVSTALSEIIVGTIAQLLIGAAIGAAILGTDESWVRMLSGTGAIVLTFLAGAELDPEVFRRKWKEATAVGLVGFFFPFFGLPFVMYFLPSIIALARSKRDLLAIFLLNFFLGWSVIGWIVALIWAAKNDVPALVR